MKERETEKKKEREKETSGYKGKKSKVDGQRRKGLLRLVYLRVRDMGKGDVA